MTTIEKMFNRLIHAAIATTGTYRGRHEDEYRASLRAARPCRECYGLGYHEDDVYGFSAPLYTEYTPCDGCDGTGVAR